MDKKQFVTGVVLRFALLIIITAAVLILRFAGGISAAVLAVVVTAAGSHCASHAQCQNQSD